jgi:hypothetical protein
MPVNLFPECCLPAATWQVPPAMADVEERRAGVREVELVFALPTAADGSAAPNKDAQLFAFLPVASYGFRCGMFTTADGHVHACMMRSMCWLSLLFAAAFWCVARLALYSKLLLPWAMQDSLQAKGLSVMHTYTLAAATLSHAAAAAAATMSVNLPPPAPGSTCRATSCCPAVGRGFWRAAATTRT